VTGTPQTESANTVPKENNDTSIGQEVVQGQNTELPAAVTQAIEQQQQLNEDVNRLTSLFYVALFLLGINTIILGIIVVLQVRMHQLVTYQRF